jgi:predicted small secreted protein
MRETRTVIRVIVALSMVVASCAGAEATGEDATTTTAETATTTTLDPSTTTTARTTGAMDHHDDTAVDPTEIAAANLATAGFQDVAVAEAAGYGNTMEALGCFENPEMGGMGLHYLRDDLMDDVVDVAEPEALVYELDAGGEITALVAHEYIVPVEAWTDEEPPSLFGVEFHQHPVLPLWVLHAWIWKDNPIGMFEDWNPKVRMCPEAVPIFGVDLP